MLSAQQASRFRGLHCTLIMSYAENFADIIEPTRQGAGSSDG